MKNKTEYVLFNSRPSNGSRLQKEIETYNILDNLKIKYTGVDPIEALQEVDSFLGVKACKNLFLCNSQKTKFYLLIMPGDKKFITKILSKQINSSRLSFADGKFMEQYLNITPGSLSIFGLIYDKELNVNLVIDKEALKDEYVGFHPCVNTTTLKLKTSDIIEKFLPYTGHEPMIVEL